jgi:hypothetical protein
LTPEAKEILESFTFERAEKGAVNSASEVDYEEYA